MARDPRARSFFERHGFLHQFEMDAIDVNVSGTLYRNAIAEYWDAEAYDAVVEREGAERAELAGGAR